MIKAPLLQSRFRGVYLGLLAIWLAASLGVGILIDSSIVPHLLQSRVESVEALVKSHHEALQYYDHRALRDSLLRGGIISRDQDFEELRPSKDQDRLALEPLLRTCRFVTEQSCVGNEQTLILSSPGPLAALQASYIVRLKSKTFSSLPGVILWKCLAALGLGLLLGFIAWAVRQQEKFLLEKTSLLIRSLSQIESLFQFPPSPTDTSGTTTSAAPMDEFMALSRGIKQAGALIQERTQQIEEYKQQFERKTRLDQLAQTIAYASHELKAPLHEGADFLQDLPEFLDSMPRESILRSAKSLERRLRGGAKSLQEALRATQASQSRPERIKVSALLRGFARRMAEVPSPLGAKLHVSTDGIDGAFIFCDPSDLEAALANLYRNSTEAKANCRVHIQAKALEGWVLIDFEDDGPGIPEPLLPQVFDEFFTTKSAGSGLGLSIAKQAISRASGEIRAVAGQQGARFEITLPLASVPTGETTQREGGLHAQA